MSAAAEAGTAARFLAVGLVATALHAVVGVLAASAGLAPTLANAIGFAVAFAASFAGHHAFTFAGRAPARRSLPRFAAVQASLFALSQASVLIGASLTEGEASRFLPALGAVVVPPMSYVLNRWWAFRTA